MSDNTNNPASSARHRNPYPVRALALVGAGSALGAVLRYGTQVVLAPNQVALMLINVVGAGLLGALTGLISHTRFARDWMPFLGTGFLGGFTTFSTVMVEVVRGGVSYNWWWMLGQGLAGVLLAWVGWTVARQFREQLVEDLRGERR